MRTKLATYALAGTLGLTGIAGAALLAPAVSYAATGDSTALSDRVTSIKEALAGLVSDGTLTQDQADQVATTLAEAGPFGGRGGGLGLLEAVEPLGITAEELRAAAEAGTTLGALADEQGVARDALVDALVSAQQERLAEAVSSGRLTQEQADARAADLEARVTQALEEPVRLRHGGHRGHGGHGGFGRHGGFGGHGGGRGMHGVPPADAPAEDAPSDSTTEQSMTEPATDATAT